MFKKYINQSNKLLISVGLIFNFIIAGCGGCQINNNVDTHQKNSSFINKISLSGNVEGFVIASCNKCNLGQTKDKKCSMGIQIDNNIYEVKNHSHNHDSAHNNDGICNALRIAYVSGKIRSNNFYANNFELIKSPE